ncbi:MAG: SDR family oxidoreductase [Vicingus serpentipes]|nr:SDR family oxidoreductase [Vicingus serpentipes]
MNILVTGASQGIGAEVVKQFARNSDTNIVAVSRNLKKLQQLKIFCAEEYKNDIHVYSINYLSSSFKSEFELILSKCQFHFDIVINNAGLLINKEFLEVLPDEVIKTYQVNLFAPIQIIQSLLLNNTDKLKKTHFLNIGSMGGYQGSAKFLGLSIYSSSKAALANLTECLAEEYKDTEIKFNCLALGSVQTEMLSKAFPDYQAQVSAEEMATYIVDFAQNGAQYFNGKVIPVSKNTP